MAALTISFAPSSPLPVPRFTCMAVRAATGPADHNDMGISFAGLTNSANKEPAGRETGELRKTGELREFGLWPEPPRAQARAEWASGLDLPPPGH